MAFRYSPKRVANGGGFSSYFTEEAAFKKHLKRFYASKGINYKTVLDTPSKFFYAIERIADAFEMATRLGEYRKAIRRVITARQQVLEVVPCAHGAGGHDDDGRSRR